MNDLNNLTAYEIITKKLYTSYNYMPYYFPEVKESNSSFFIKDNDVIDVDIGTTLMTHYLVFDPNHNIVTGGGGYTNINPNFYLMKITLPFLSSYTNSDAEIDYYISMSNRSRFKVRKKSIDGKYTEYMEESIIYPIPTQAENSKIHFINDLQLKNKIELQRNKSKFAW